MRNIVSFCDAFYIIIVFVYADLHKNTKMFVDEFFCQHVFLKKVMIADSFFRNMLIHSI